MEIRLLQKEDIDRLGIKLPSNGQDFGLALSDSSGADIADNSAIAKLNSYFTKQIAQQPNEQFHQPAIAPDTSNQEFIYLALEELQLIGFGILTADGSIPLLYCHPDYQRRGVGIQLCRTIVTKALELGLNRLSTQATPATREFFKNRGFQIVKEWREKEAGEAKIYYLMERYLEEVQQFVVATFYHFADLPDYQEMQPQLKDFCDLHHLKGTILLAQEGINSTIVGTRQEIDALLDYLRSDQRLQNLEHKESFCQVKPFQKMRVRLKKEIVTLGVPGIDPSREVGQYVEPKDWNKLISDPEVVVIDTRNIYEVNFGTFNGAIDPQITTFGQFPNYVAENLNPEQQQKVAMFCTGGIRCEKASAYLLAQGFKEVYHLKGGILKYIAEVPPEESLWEGECFVFDDRITL